MDVLQRPDHLVSRLHFQLQPQGQQEAPYQPPHSLAQTPPQDILSFAPSHPLYSNKPPVLISQPQLTSPSLARRPHIRSTLDPPCASSNSCTACPPPRPLEAGLLLFYCFTERAWEQKHAIARPMKHVESWQEDHRPASSSLAVERWSWPSLLCELEMQAVVRREWEGSGESVRVMV